jgi:hypothetical protein
MNPHVLIATPAYSGKVNVQYALALSDTIGLLRASGVTVSTKIVTSGSLLVAERNRLLEYFFQSDATHILCIDGDLGWPAQAVLAMLQTQKDFVAGVYPARGAKAFTFRPVLDSKEAIVRDNHLLKMEYVPSGFMLISKEAVKKMRDFFPELYYSPKDPRSEKESTFCLFNTEVYEGEFWGEDYVFCRRAREAGVDIWVDPLIQFDHDGNIGMLMEALSDKPPVEQDHANTSTVTDVEFIEKAA